MLQHEDSHSAHPGAITRVKNAYCVNEMRPKGRNGQWLVQLELCHANALPSKNAGWAAGGSIKSDWTIIKSMCLTHMLCSKLSEAACLSYQWVCMCGHPSKFDFPSTHSFCFFFKYTHAVVVVSELSVHWRVGDSPWRTLWLVVMHSHQKHASSLNTGCSQ